ncbi:hypothetical protein E4T44_06609 [Aureobasidium sp. EXF-8845]|nr:hypothetical protein E4T44_06609 [Aureobasidium sp. EXF-8845]
MPRRSREIHAYERTRKPDDMRITGPMTASSATLASLRRLEAVSGREAKVRRISSFLFFFIIIITITITTSSVHAVQASISCKLTIVDVAKSATVCLLQQ